MPKYIPKGRWIWGICVGLCLNFTVNSVSIL